MLKNATRKINIYIFKIQIRKKTIKKAFNSKISTRHLQLENSNLHI